MRYVKLMAHGKPHLLTGVVNNLGAETRISYAPSTQFYLQDKRDGKPWITRLPFPVHVVERVETYDRISQNRFVTRHAYHHGYFDGEEREFRGFGMVEQWDTETFAALGAAPSANNAAASHVPPVVTRSWFHTGFYLGRESISKHFEEEYFADAGLTALVDTILPGGLTVDEEREACRALKGSLLRREVYADDAPANATAAEISRARTPYVATEANFTIRLVQARGTNRHGVFFVHSRESITAHYERQADDPRVEHVVTLAVDSFGNVLQQATIGYGRRTPDATLPTDEDRRKQALIHITYVDNRVTNAIAGERDHYRTPLPAESRTYELRKPVQETTGGGVTSTYRFADVMSAIAQAADGQHEVKYEDLDFAAAQQAVANDAAEGNRYFRRRIECVRELYRPDDCGAAQGDRLALLPLAQVERHALIGTSYKLAFTPGLLTGVFKRPRAGQPDEALLPQPAQVLGGTGADRGGYVDLDGDGHWWISSGRSFFALDPTASPGAELQEAQHHFYLARRYRDPFDADTLVDYDAPNDLLVVESRDALGNRLTANANDYRVLQPRLVSDANRNQTQVVFDTLGLVAGTAVMGKPTDNPALGDKLDAQFDPDPSQATIDAFVAKPREAAAALTVASQEARGLLANATTRIVYDVTRYMRIGEAPFAATIARETHVSDLAAGNTSKLQIAFSYSDGFGREIQKKVQAEPGPVVKGGPDVYPRWIGSGWTIFNNKGKPVRQYEPFFTGSSLFEFGMTKGVSPVVFYDPVERSIATLHPNHSYVKVRFDAWRHVSYDVNDTCAARNAETGDPRTDPDIRGYVGAYFQSQPANWQTWQAQRATGLLGQDEQTAAARAAAHADTPTRAYFDSLGRTFLTVADNRVVCAGHDLDGTESVVVNRLDLDVEGNQRAVRDERALPVNGLPAGAVEQRIVMRSTFDMVGTVIHTESMEAGERWILKDVGGKPIRGWDSRGHTFTTSYDTLRRPVAQWVRGTTPSSDPRTLNKDTQFGAAEYAEGLPNAEALNLRTRTYRQYDEAGELTSARLDANGDPAEAYDFKGNLRCSTRRLTKTYSGVPDWSQNRDAQLDAERFEGWLRYDALNRSIQSIATFSSVVRAGRPNRINVVQHAFNDANFLERVDVWLERAADPATILDPAADAPTAALGVRGVEYDEKGQRLRIDYKNGTTTSYEYDSLTFRLTRLATAAGAAQIQDLNYTYDPVGNVTHIRDDAQQTIFFKNQRVDPSSDYVYDSLYRLIQAKGREHLGQNRPIPHSYDDAARTRIATADAAGHFAPNDKGAMGTYTERYVYDAVGNFLQMQHERSDAAVPGWTRRYTYAEASPIEGNRVSNRLTSTRVGTGPNEVYGYDAHGNMLQMPQLQEMRWDFHDQLQLSRRQRVDDEDTDGVAREGERTFYVYDTSGQRVRKVTELSGGGVKDERIYLGACELYRMHGGAAPVSAATATFERETMHLMDDTRRIALVETRSLDTAGVDNGRRQLIRYQLANHLGSASLELDDAAELISYEEYSPYGSTTYQAVRALTGAGKRYRFTAKERDEETGLYYHGARYYAPWLGRWTSADRTGVGDGLNLYEYVHSRPTASVDPDGNQALKLAPPVTPAPSPAPFLRLVPELPAAAAELEVEGELAGEVGLAGEVSLAEGLGMGEVMEAAGPLSAQAAAYFLTAQRWLRRSGSIVQYGNPWGAPTKDLFFPLLKDVKQQQAAQWQRRQREIQAENWVADGTLTDEEAKDYVRTGNVLMRSSGDVKQSDVTATEQNASKKDPVSKPKVPGAVNDKGQLALPAHGTADLKQNKAGQWVDRNLQRAQRAKGGNQNRGTQGEEYVEGVSGSHGGQRAAQTDLGDRRHDITDDEPLSQTDFRREVKNYQLWNAAEGRWNAVPLSEELFTQAVKDAEWVKEGKVIGQDRVVQWDFVGAPPSWELSNMLDHLNIPYVVHH
jgi:RHS repeat-associated protein